MHFQTSKTLLSVNLTQKDPLKPHQEAIIKDFLSLTRTNACKLKKKKKSASQYSSKCKPLINHI